jgi:hypothetical protein
MPHSEDRRQRDRPARVEIHPCSVSVFAPYSADLTDAMRTLGGRWRPGSWVVDHAHLAEALELVAEIHPVTVADLRSAG